MQINYSLNKRDVLFSRLVYTFQNKMLLVFALLAICSLALTISTGDEARKYSAVVRIVAAIFALGFSAGLFLTVMVLLNLILVYSSKLMGVIGAHTMEVKDDGLEESNAVDKSFHRWNASFRVKEFGNYVWIYPTDQKLYLIPRGPGRCRGDLAGFLDQIRAKTKPQTATPATTAP